MEISQLLLDVLSKTNNFQKRLLYFRPKLTAKQGSSAGTVLDPLLDYIGNAQNWTAVSVQFLKGTATLMSTKFYMKDLNKP